MIFPSSALILGLAASALAKKPSKDRTYAVNYFYGKGPLVEGRIDPIVNPGQMSPHVHTIMGGSGFSPNMDLNAALKSHCTTSKPKADGSNYWWPKLYFKDPNNGSFTDVNMYYAKVYYFFEPTDDEIKAFPPGFRMVTGDAQRRGPNSKKGDLNIDSGAGEINPVQFVCGTKDNRAVYPKGSDGTKGIGIADSNVGGHGVGFPNQNCDGYTTPLRYDIHFPSCIDTTKPLDYKNNAVFPSSKGSKNGQNCPKGFTHVPHIFIEVYWDTVPFASLWKPGGNTQPFVLSNGDPTGYSLHGDFISGWDQTKLQDLIDTCDAGDAGFDKCGNINKDGGVNDSSGSCTIPTPYKSDKIKGNMSKLPGCNPLQWGPGPAKPMTSGCDKEYHNTNTGAVAKAKSPTTTVAAATQPASKSTKSSSSKKAAYNDKSVTKPTPAAKAGTANGFSGMEKQVGKGKSYSPVLTSLGPMSTFLTASFKPSVPITSVPGAKQTDDCEEEKKKKKEAAKKKKSHSH